MTDRAPLIFTERILTGRNSSMFVYSFLYIPTKLKMQRSKYETCSLL